MGELISGPDPEKSKRMTDAILKMQKIIVADLQKAYDSAQKFKTRYATFGFSDKANLDEGALWPVAFALKELTATEEARISPLVKKAVS